MGWKVREGGWWVGWLISKGMNEFRVTLGEGRDQVGFCGRKRRKSIGQEVRASVGRGGKCVSEGTERE